MEKVVSKIVGLGVPGLILLTAIEATGLAGAAAITAALAAIGPGGMIGGIVFLGATALIIDGLSEFGFDAIFSAVIRELFVRGETKESLKQKIARYPVSANLKARLCAEVDSFVVG